MNVLIMSSDPRNASHLRLATERRELEEALRGTRFRERFNLHDVGGCRVRDITRALDQYKPKILHFRGHGDGSGIYFERDDGQAVTVNNSAFGELLGSQEGLDLVVLNACYSHDQAQAIANSVGYVVGMEGAFSDDDAIAFSREFYRALGDGRTYDDAFQRARLAVALTSTLNPHLLRGTMLRQHETRDAVAPDTSPQVPIRYDRQAPRSYVLAEQLQLTSVELANSIQRQVSLRERLAAIRRWSIALQEYLESYPDEPEVARTAPGGVEMCLTTIVRQVDMTADPSRLGLLYGSLDRETWVQLIQYLRTTYQAVLNIHARLNPAATLLEQEAVFGPLSKDMLSDLNRGLSS